MDISGALLTSAVTMAIPLLLAGLGELVSERAGVINVGLEGMMLTAAFAAMVTVYFSGSPLLGILSGAMTGVTLAGVFALAVVIRNANQVVTGIALNLLAVGVTGVAYRSVFGITGSALMIPGLSRVALPGLSGLPLIGEALFTQTIVGYLAFLLVPACAFLISGSVPGLLLRMVGENPHAAAAQGVSVVRVRMLAILACGALAGIGGAYLSVVYARTFVEGMSAGRGFIALAIVIFGRWSPWGILGAALVFGLASALQFHFQASGLSIPYQFFLMLPYVVTLLALAMSAGRTKAPAALGQPYLT
jgi:simple sugar transport system permease protein